MLCWGKPVIVPVALAFYFAFVLTPPSEWLERYGVPRPLSVASVMGAALAAVAVLGSVVLAQAADLAGQLKTYAVQVREKLSGLRDGRLGVFDELGNALAEFSRALDREAVSETPTPVKVVSGGFSAYARLEQGLGPLLGPLAMTTVVLVMTLFVLSHREDLRARLIQLVGPENVTVTTRTLGEAVKRVSHLLLTQAYINVAFGAAVALGLYAIGIPYALLWGAIAGVLRFVPLLGSMVAAALPALAAFAIFPGWRELLLTLALSLLLDTLVAQFIEPLVLGKRTGVSALALLISALFWTWLWGPLGLVLATPLTVCAAVVGRHVPELSFLTIALGDETGLSAAVNFYQRTLARATKDALRLAKRHVAERGLPQTFDELLVPALGLMAVDQNHQTISQSACDRVVKDLGDIVARLAGSDASAAQGTPAVAGIPAESSADSLLLQMLRADALPLAPRQQLLERVLAERPALICIAALPPAGHVNARFFCRRLRNALPLSYIVVLSPEDEAKRSPEAAARLREAGANQVVHSLSEAARLLEERRRVTLERTQAEPSLRTSLPPPSLAS
ncbi:MAG: AI-2E family transporter [Polyangiaceae bacterium]